LVTCPAPRRDPGWRLLKGVIGTLVDCAAETREILKSIQDDGG
jgi:hypothetical protein